jgi:D-alanyl-lipoteichoic acid acyltransferase DltB (MBOAT superfamily)
MKNILLIILAYGLFVTFVMPKLLPTVLHMIGSRSSPVLAPIEEQYFFFIAMMSIAVFAICFSLRQFKNTP